jgi:hypothetical protein
MKHPKFTVDFDILFHITHQSSKKAQFERDIIDPHRNEATRSRTAASLRRFSVASAIS